MQGTAEVSAEDIEGNLSKARSLGNALLVFTTVPWFLCAVFFSGLHWTYPRDKKRTREWAEEIRLAAGEEREQLAPRGVPSSSEGGEGDAGPRLNLNGLETKM